MFTPHGHYVAPRLPGEQPSATVMQCGGVKVCPECTAFELDAYRMFIAPHLDNPEQQRMPSIPAVLTSPAPSQSAPTSEPLAVSIDGLRDWYQRYLELKDAESKIKDMLAEAREKIVEQAKAKLADLPQKTDFTIDGKPVLQLQKVTQRRIDSKRMKATRPDLYAAWSVESVQERLNIL